MIQFYFLSVLLNILVGLILVYSKTEKDDSVAEGGDDISSAGEKRSVFSKVFGKGSYTDDEMFYLVVALLSVFVGFIKLLSAVNGVPFFGDLVPALAGFAGGISVLVEYFEKKSSSPLMMNKFFTLVFVESRKYVGIACIAAGIIHFVLPGVLFL